MIDKADAAAAALMTSLFASDEHKQAHSQTRKSINRNLIT